MVLQAFTVTVSLVLYRWCWPHLSQIMGSVLSLGLLGELSTLMK